VQQHGAVLVHVDAPEAVDLQRRTGEKYPPFEIVCTSPCDTLVPAEGDYRVTNDTIRTSRRFRLPDGAGRTTIRVEPSSSIAFAGGIMLASLGVVAVGTGLLLAIAGGAGGTPANGTATNDSWRVPVAYTLGVGGAVAVFGGLVLLISNRRTSVTLTSASIPVLQASY
jgi:hypothetical protein